MRIHPLMCRFTHYVRIHPQMCAFAHSCAYSPSKCAFTLYCAQLFHEVSSEWIAFTHDCAHSPTHVPFHPLCTHSLSVLRNFSKKSPLNESHLKTSLNEFHIKKSECSLKFVFWTLSPNNVCNLRHIPSFSVSPPELSKLENTKFLGTNSNQIKTLIESQFEFVSRHTEAHPVCISLISTLHECAHTPTHLHIHTSCALTHQCAQAEVCRVWISFMSSSTNMHIHLLIRLHMCTLPFTRASWGMSHPNQSHINTPLMRASTHSSAPSQIMCAHPLTCASWFM